MYELTTLGFMFSLPMGGGDSGKEGGVCATNVNEGEGGIM